MKLHNVVIVGIGSKTDAEVVGGAKALYNRHAYGFNPDAIQPQQSSLDSGPKLQQQVLLSQAFRDKGGRVWLYHVDNAQDATPTLLLANQSTTELSDVADEVGVYLVFHCQEGIPGMFGLFYAQALNPQAAFGELGDPSESLCDRRTRYAAVELVKLLKDGLKLQKIDQICLVACNTARDSAQKNFLRLFMLALHDGGYAPKVAGYDKPIVVGVGNDENYGRKIYDNTEGKTVRVSAQPERPKFFYVYQGDVSKEFSVKTGDTEQTTIDSQVEAFKKKFGKSLGQGEALVASRHKVVKQSDTKKGYKAKLEALFIKRLRYTQQGWNGI